MRSVPCIVDPVVDIAPIGEPRRIRALSTLVANQIAAGEVVERPASVVKELIENSIDAGATRIVLELEQGGVELVRVTDDGRGIVADDLTLALSPHATSKIAAASDLERVATLGFRGEALASIASVSRISIRSRTHDAANASVVDAEAAVHGSIRPAPGPVGTCVTVRNLFFNTPARRKFLRTVGTEQSRCIDVVKDLAIAHPAVGFEASADGRQALNLPRNQSPKSRACAVLGEELADELIEAHADTFDDSRGIALWALVGRPSIARATNKSIRIYVNGRAVRDRTIQHAISEAYRGLLEHGRFPTAILMIDMAPEAVDVNVHPAKAEVRFRDSGMVHSVVLRAVRDALREADLTPTFSILRAGMKPEGMLPGSRAGFEWNTGGIVRADSSPKPNPKAFINYFHREPKSTTATDSIVASVVESKPFAQVHDDVPTTQERHADVRTNATANSGPLHGHDDAGLPLPTPPVRIMQIHKSFVVTEDEQGVVIIDQHALHERVMFEYLLARLSETDGRSLESQTLLSPIPVKTTPQRLDRLDDLKPLLDRIGAAATPLSPDTLGVHAFPTFLFSRGVDPADFFEGLLEKAENDSFSPGSEEAMRDVLDMMACKAAVKAGDKLGEVELAELVKLRGEVERSSNCPHGRPTSIRLSIRELEKLFGRT